MSNVSAGSIIGNALIAYGAPSTSASIAGVAVASLANFPQGRIKQVAVLNDIAVPICMNIGGQDVRVPASTSFVLDFFDGLKIESAPTVRQAQGGSAGSASNAICVLLVGE